MVTIYVSNKYGEKIKLESKGFTKFFKKLQKGANLIEGTPHLKKIKNPSNTTILILEPEQSNFLHEILDFIKKGGCVLYAYGMAGDPQHLISENIGEFENNPLTDITLNLLDLNKNKIAEEKIVKTQIKTNFTITLNSKKGSIPLIKNDKNKTHCTLIPIEKGKLILLTPVFLLSNKTLSKYEKLEKWVNKTLIPIITREPPQKIEEKQTPEEEPIKRTGPKKKTSEEIENILKEIILVNSSEMEEALKSTYHIGLDKLEVKAIIRIKPEYDYRAIEKKLGSKFGQITILSVENAVPEGFKIDPKHKGYDSPTNTLKWDGTWCTPPDPVFNLEARSEEELSREISYTIHPNKLVRGVLFNPVLIIGIVREHETIEKVKIKLLKKEHLITVLSPPSKEKSLKIEILKETPKPPLKNRVHHALKCLKISKTALQEVEENPIPIETSINLPKRSEKQFRNIQDVLKDPRYKLFFVTGPPLSGKTLFAAQLITQTYKDQENPKIVAAAPNAPTEKIEETIIKNYNETVLKKYSLPEEIFSELKENETFDIWLDVDHYYHRNAAKKAASFIETVQRYYQGVRIFLVSSEKLLEEIKNEIGDKEILDNAVTIRIHSLELQEVEKIILKKYPNQENIKEVVKRILSHDKRFTKVPYVHALLKALEEYDKKCGIEKISPEEFCNVIIGACKYLRDELEIDEKIKGLEKFSLDLEYVPKSFNVEKSLRLKNCLKPDIQEVESLTAAPMFFRNPHPIALDFESNFIVPRKIETETEKIIHETPVLVIVGDSGCGKTSLALKLAYKKWKDGHIALYSQCYKMDETDKIKKLNHPTILVLDDIHLDPKNFIEVIRTLTPHKFIKIIATSRKPLQKILAGEEFEEALKTVKEVEVEELSFREAVKKILEVLKKQKIAIIEENLENLVEKIVERTKQTFYLLKFLLHPFMHKKMKLTLENLKKVKICESIRGYISEMVFGKIKEIDRGIADEEENELIKALYYVSLFSQYEIPVPTEMIEEKGIKKDIIENLVKIGELTKGKEWMEWTHKYQYLIDIPHPSLAKTYQQCFKKLKETLKIDETEELTNLISNTPHLLAVTTIKLSHYNKKLLEKQIKKLLKTPEKLKNIIQKTSLTDIGYFFYELGRAGLSGVAKNVAEAVIDVLKRKEKFDSADLKDIGDFFLGLGWSGLSGVAKNVAEAVIDVLKRKEKFDSADLKDIGYFFLGLGEARLRDVAKNVAEAVIDVLKRKEKFDSADLKDIGDFFHGLGLAGLSGVAKNVAEAVIDVLKRKFDSADLKDIGYFFLRLGWAGLRDVAKNVVSFVEGVLRSKILRCEVGQVRGLFFGVKLFDYLPLWFELPRWLACLLLEKFRDVLEVRGLYRELKQRFKC